MIPDPTAQAPPGEEQGPPVGERDAGKVRNAFPRGPGRPPGAGKKKKRSHRRIRPAPAPGAAAGGPAMIEEEPPELTKEERDFWGRQVQAFFGGIAALRGKHWGMPDAVADAAGEPAALTARKYLPGVMEDWPEFVLIGVLAPFVVAALRVELDAYQARSAARRRERGSLRPEGVRQDEPVPGFDGAPILPAGTDR